MGFLTLPREPALPAAMFKPKMQVESSCCRCLLHTIEPMRPCSVLSIEGDVRAEKIFQALGFYTGDDMVELLSDRGVRLFAHWGLR